MRRLVVVLAACGHAPAPPAPAPTPAPPVAQVPADAPEAKQEDVLAAIQLAMNHLDTPAHQCWARAATERFDIEGKLEAQITVGDHGADVSLTPHLAVDAPVLATCMHDVLASFPWAPELRGQTFVLPFEFKAPDGQSVIDRELVSWHAQDKLAVAVLLDENNTGNAAASMLEIALKPGGTTGMRWADRAELWYFFGSADVKYPKAAPRSVSAGDMLYVPKGSTREVVARDTEVHAMIVFVPGGREGTARAGALPNSEHGAGTVVIPPITVLLAKDAKTYGPATIYTDVLRDKPLAASILQLPAGAHVPEHAHDKETELLYVLDGSGTLTVAGTDVAVTPTSAIQIPPATKHAFVAATAVRAVQIYTPAGPEQRFKKK